VLELLIGAILAILTTIAIERLRKPSLRIYSAPPRDREYAEGKPASLMRYLILRLVNKPLPWYARWMSRDTAVQCRGNITFHHLDGQNLFGRAMPLRWAGSLQPIAIRVFLNGLEGYIVDDDRLSAQSIVDVPPGSERDIDVAVRLDDDKECYGWSNESYLSNPPWRNPNWKLDPGRYLVRVTIFSGGQSCTAVFRLLNEGRREDFRLEEPMLSDRPRD
jgi:hypothetical protein